MTREEKEKLIRHLRYNLEIGADYLITDEDAVEIIKALEQMPCDDCVSRQAVLDALDKSKYSNEFCEEHHIDWSINLGMAHIVVNELKPVIPQPKMGGEKE